MKRSFPRTDLYCITDYGLSLGRSNIDVVKELIAADVKMIQYREKERKTGVMLEECRVIRELTRAAGVTFIVNDYVDIALLVDADGVHVGQDDLPVKAVRELLGPDKIIGISTHAPEQARAAEADGADYIGVGPIFATKTKKDVCEPVGLEYLEYVVKYLDIPFTAIGGIKIENLPQVVRAGASCVSIISGLVGQQDIGAAVAAARKAMQI